MSEGCRACRLERRHRRTVNASPKASYSTKVKRAIRSVLLAMRRSGFYIVFAVSVLVLFNILMGYGMLPLSHQAQLGHKSSVMPADVVVAKAMPGNPGRLFYNRVPKCGSTTVTTILEQLAPLNGFTIHHSENFDDIILSVAEQIKFVDFFSGLPPKTAFDRHIYFTNFTRYGKPSPLYYNVVRHPLERVVSLYYYLRFHRFTGTGVAPIFPMSDKERNMTYNECVARKKKECLEAPQMIPFFCGHERYCRAPRKPAPLATAKQNVVQYFQLVGIVEDMEAFFRLAAYTFPDYFKGAPELYAKAPEKKHNSNNKKDDVTPETEAIMKKVMPNEYEFYEFIKQRFYTMYRKAFGKDTDTVS